MTCLTAIQQKSGLHRDVQDAAGTSKGVSTFGGNEEGSKLCLGGKQLPRSQVFFTFYKFWKSQHVTMIP